jgi:homogentisate 1,2-dioxygenase
VESGGSWSLRPEETPSLRRADLESAAQVLVKLASQMGYGVVRRDEPLRLILWQETSHTTYAFYLLASAVVGRILRQDPYPSAHPVLVLPGGRAGLLAYKLQRDPTLKKVAEPWRTLKFRTLRRLAEGAPLTRDRWEKELAGDPIEPPEQMKLL